MNAMCPGRLRRVDWRFLLPAPAGESYDHAWIAGADATLTAALAGTGLARRLSAGLSCDSEHDLVLLPPVGVSVERAVRALRPGGVLCWQVDRRRSGSAAMSPARACARLRALGLGPAEVYWTRGGHDRPVSYVPLGADEPMRWYAQQALASRRLPVPAILPLGGAFMRMSRRAASSAVSSFTVVAVADRRAGRDAVTPAITRRWSSTTGAAGTVFLLGGEGDWSRVAALPFESDRLAPAAVLKVPRSVRFNRNIEHEWAVLGRVRGAMGSVADAVPEPIGAFELNGLRGTVERRVDGAPLRLLARGRRSRTRAVEELGRGTRWLIDLHRTPAAGAGVVALRDIVTPVLERYGGTFQHSAAEVALLERFGSELRENGDRVVPLVWEHHDFGPWNLLRRQGALAVIDWEVARPGIGLCDLLFFVMHWNWEVRGARTEEGRLEALRALIFPGESPDELGLAASAAIGEYLREHRIEPRLLPLAMIHLLAEQSLDRVARLRALSMDSPADRATNRYAGYLEGLARVGARLFDEPIFRPTGLAR